MTNWDLLVKTQAYALLVEWTSSKKTFTSLDFKEELRRRVNLICASKKEVIAAAISDLAAHGEIPNMRKILQADVGIFIREEWEAMAFEGYVRYEETANAGEGQFYYVYTPVGDSVPYAVPRKVLS